MVLELVVEMARVSIGVAELRKISVPFESLEVMAMTGARNRSKLSEADRVRAIPDPK